MTIYDSLIAKAIGGSGGGGGGGGDLSLLTITIVNNFGDNIDGHGACVDPVNWGDMSTPMFTLDDNTTKEVNIIAYKDSAIIWLLDPNGDYVPSAKITVSDAITKDGFGNLICTGNGTITISE